MQIKQDRYVYYLFVSSWLFSDWYMVLLFRAPNSLKWEAGNCRVGRTCNYGNRRSMLSQNGFPTGSISKSDY